ncbi:MAG: tRNA adenosine(34) deaminase TadA [Myxococcota bacterium]
MDMQPTDLKWMREALELAKQAAEIGEVPIGAVVVLEDRLVGKGMNRREIDANPLAHAEVLAIADAAENLGRWRLSGCTLYVTVEPCPMCAGALVNARVDRLVYGAQDPKAGAVQSLYQITTDARLNHRMQVTGGVLAAESGDLMSGFFKHLRSRRLNDR